MTPLLQWYIFRELGKTFLLWAVGLTLVFALCGGVVNMIKVEGASAIQMVQIMGFVLPVALTLTLPVSALVSTTLTYGRLSADNEFNACRSSGINIHHLLLPSLIISTLVAVFTAAFYNFVIPHFVFRLDQILREDLHKIVTSQLRTHGSIPFRNYVMYADEIVDNPKLFGVKDRPDDPLRKQILIRGGAFIELGGEDWLRFGTSKSAVIRFDNTGPNPTISADLHDIHGYDRARNQRIDMRHQLLGPYPIPRTFEMEAKWLDLGSLLYYRRKPEEMTKVKSYVNHLRTTATETLFYHHINNTLREPPNAFHFKLADRNGTLTTEALAIDPKTQNPAFKNVTVLIRGAGRTQKYLAETGSLRAHVAKPLESSTITINLRGLVRLFDSQALDPTQPIKKTREAVGPFPMNPDVLGQVKQYSDHDLLTKDLAHLSTYIENSRVGIQTEIQKLVLDITSIIHARSAFSASVFVLVILGAALGIIFRGSDYLTAFFVSFLPGLLIVVLIITGRQLTEKPNTTDIGIAVIWSSIALMAAADGVILFKFLRR